MLVFGVLVPLRLYTKSLGNVREVSSSFESNVSISAERRMEGKGKWGGWAGDRRKEKNGQRERQRQRHTDRQTDRRERERFLDLELRGKRSLVY